MILCNYKQPNSAWKIVLPKALHSIQSLLCAATNATPHVRLLKFDRRSMLGRSLPHWLVQPGPVLLRRFIINKKQPRVDTVELIEANPNFAHIRFPDGRESTVSVSDLALSQSLQSVSDADNDSILKAAKPKNYITTTNVTKMLNSYNSDLTVLTNAQIILRLRLNIHLRPLPAEICHNFALNRWYPMIILV